MAYLDEGGDGVSGWLGAFVVMYGIFTPLGLLLNMYWLYTAPNVAVLPPGAWPTIQLVAWGMTAATSAVAWYMCWGLFRRQLWRTVPITIALLWAVGLAALATSVARMSLLTGLPFFYLLLNVFRRGDILEIARLGICVAWTVYFLVSDRVAITYPRHPGDEELRHAFD